jgi:hypothetical protein
MPEPSPAQSMGSRLLAVELPPDAVWERYRRRMESAMSELDDRIRRFKRTRWIAFGVYALYVAVGAISFYQRRMGDLELGVLAVWAIVMFVMGTLIVGVFHVDRTHLEIRRDIKELTLAVLELKEGLSKRAGQL